MMVTFVTPVFEKLVSKADASDISEHLAVQYNVTGEGEGAFYMEVKDGKVEVQPYDYKDRDILVTADGQTMSRDGNTLLFA